jgi:hypothetical protein
MAKKNTERKSICRREVGKFRLSWLEKQTSVSESCEPRESSMEKTYIVKKATFYRTVERKVKSLGDLYEAYSQNLLGGH